MPTQQDIDAAAERWRLARLENRPYIAGDERRRSDPDILADAYLAEHASDDKPPTREMFERLYATKSNTVATMEWFEGHPHPYLVSCDRTGIVELDTIAKLRAACLLLGIEWRE